MECAPYAYLHELLTNDSNSQYIYRSLVSKYTQISPDDCRSQSQQSKAFVFEDKGSADEANSLNITYATFLRLESDGDLRAYTLNDTRYPNSTAVWRNFSSLFDGRSLNPCRLPLFCGFYGVCQEEFQNCSSDCGGSQTFVLQDPTNPKSGCKLKDDSELMEPNITTLSDLALCHSKNFFMHSFFSFILLISFGDKSIHITMWYEGLLKSLHTFAICNMNMLCHMHTAPCCHMPCEAYSFRVTTCFDICNMNIRSTHPFP